jgi:hypothetical protein
MKLLVSFSGGETSAFMAQWLKNHAHEHGFTELVFVFANTGWEHDETLEFAHRCDEHFNLNLVWLESVFNPYGEGVGYKITDYELASRKGEPFDKGIQKHGLPSAAAPWCSNELKARPIRRYARDLWGDNYYTAIGIRKDEFDRMSSDAKQRKIVYPLISYMPTDKPRINLYWSGMPFRLNIPSYLSNCLGCYKKGDRALFAAYQKEPSIFDFALQMEKYETFISDERKEFMLKKGKPIPERFKMYREQRSASEMIEQAKIWNGKPLDERQNMAIQYDLFETESCDIYSNCGDNDSND